MTNAEKIRSMSDYELAETYINVLDFNAPLSSEKIYQSKHSGEIFCEKEDAIKTELEWLRKECEE